MRENQVEEVSIFGVFGSTYCQPINIINSKRVHTSMSGTALVYIKGLLQMKIWLFTMYSLFHTFSHQSLIPDSSTLLPNPPLALMNGGILPKTV